MIRLLMIANAMSERDRHSEEPSWSK